MSEKQWDDSKDGSSDDVLKKDTKYKYAQSLTKNIEKKILMQTFKKCILIIIIGQQCALFFREKQTRIRRNTGSWLAGMFFSRNRKTFGLRGRHNRVEQYVR